MTAEDEIAHNAFLDYVEAKAFAEATSDFDAACAAAQAWVAFLNVFLPDNQKMPVKAVSATNIVPFPRNYGANQ